MDNSSPPQPTPDSQSIPPPPPPPPPTASDPIDHLQPPAAPLPATSGGLQKKILVVDDDEIMRESYVSLLTSNETEVWMAEDGKKAWEMLEGGFIPDIIFTGILMPEMTGFELIEKIKTDAKYARIKIAISSHQGLPEHKKMADSLGVDDFIIRGTTPPREGVRRIRSLLGLKNAFRIQYSVNDEGADSFLTFINHQSGMKCVPGESGAVALEIEDSENGTFKIRPIC